MAVWHDKPATLEVSHFSRVDSASSRCQGSRGCTSMKENKFLTGPEVGVTAGSGRLTDLGAGLVTVAGGELGAAFRDDSFQENGNAFVSVAGVEADQDIPRQGAGRDPGNVFDLGKPVLQEPLEVLRPVEALDFEACPPGPRGMNRLDHVH